MKNHKQLRVSKDFTINNFKDYATERIAFIKATGTITTTGNPGNNETFTLTNASGTSVTFVFKTGVTTVDGTKDGDNVIIGVSGALGSAASVGDRIRTSIGNSGLGIVATETGSGAMTLTQDIIGPGGNTEIDMSGVATTTATNFTNGDKEASPAVTAPFQPPFSYLKPGVHSLRRK